MKIKKYRMNILYYSTFQNQDIFLKKIKLKFKSHNIYTINDKFDFKSIDVAMVWKLPDKYLKKLSNLKLIFSLGAGVDHILNLPSYNNAPIVRIKDPNMRKRMFNYILSQILIYQLKLNIYRNAQQKKIWLDVQNTSLNHNLTIGILGLGYIGEYVANKLSHLDYNIIGYKKNKPNHKLKFPIFLNKNSSRFISKCDILVSILPATKDTNNFINKSFLSKLKKQSLLINIGRGSSLNEKDLYNHLKVNKDFYASLDVFNKEPLNKNHFFWKQPNIIITPHIAAITDIESSIEYMYERFLTYIKKNKIKSDVDIVNGY